MAFGKQTCSKCGYEASNSARFCPECGTALGGTKPCVHCRAQIPTAAQFCPQCGRPQTEATRPPDLRGSVWRSAEDEFAVRVERDDLKGRLFKDLEIQPGQQGVFLVDGRALEERKGPGRYQVDSFFERLLSPGFGRHVTALVVRGDPVSLEFQFPKLYTSDDFELSGRVVLAVQVANPPTFFANVMRSRQTLTLAELRSFLFEQVRNAVQDVVGKRSLHQFKQQSLDLGLRANLGTAIDRHLQQTLEQSGLAVSQVTTSDFVHPRFDALRREWEEIALFRDEAEAARTRKVDARSAALAERKGLWEVELEEADQTTLEQQAQARIFEERAQVREQMRQAVLSERMSEVRTEEQLAVFLREIDKNKLLRDDEWQGMQRDFAERKEEHELARAHLLAQLKMERDYELRMAQALRSHELTLEQLGQQRIEQDFRQQTQIMLEEEQAAWDIRLQEQRNNARRAEQAAEAAARREQELLDRQQTLSLQLQQARTAAEVEAIERQQDQMDLDLAMQAMERLKAIKRKDEEERALLALRVEREKAEMTLQAEQRRMETQLQAERQRHQQELERVDRLGQLSTEALIAVAGTEQAALLADLKRTETLKGMTDEQILAMAADKSPEVAKAFQEKFRAMAEGKMSQREQALYERMIEDQKLAGRAQAELAEAQGRRQQEMFTEALRSQAEVAKAFAGSQPAAPTVIIPGAGMAGYGSPAVIGASGLPGGSEVQICPRCRVKQPVGTKFCTNCSHQFFE